MQAWIADAFADEMYAGNQAVVVPCVDRFPPSARMQAVARTLRAPTTAFVVCERSPGGYAIRWFTPRAELDLCGHATMCSACYMYEVGGLDESSELRFCTRSQVLRARRRGSNILLDLPRMDAVVAVPPHGLSQALGARIVNFVRASDDIVVELESEQCVAGLRPDFQMLAGIECRGHIVTARSDRANVDFVSRSFFPALGVDEDQVCVSAHCKLGPYWAGRLRKEELVALQLSANGGRLLVNVMERRIEVAGTSRVRGCLNFDDHDLRLTPCSDSRDGRFMQWMP